MEKIKIEWKSGMAFEADIDGQKLVLDVPQEDGAVIGVRPKPLMLVALAGCTGMDAASLIKKMRLDVESLNIEALAQKTESMPVVYTEFVLNYSFVAPEEQKEKIIKIVTNSQEKYCGVAEMLRKIAPLKYNVFLNNELILAK